MSLGYSAAISWGINLGSSDDEALEKLCSRDERLDYLFYGTRNDFILILDRGCKEISDFGIEPIDSSLVAPPTRDEIDLLKDAYIEYFGLNNEDERPNDDIVQLFLSLSAV